VELPERSPPEITVARFFASKQTYLTLIHNVTACITERLNLIDGSSLTYFDMVSFNYVLIESSHPDATRTSTALQLSFSLGLHAGLYFMMLSK
jgi:hypothetical protein